MDEGLAGSQVVLCSVNASFFDMHFLHPFNSLFFGEVLSHAIDNDIFHKCVDVLDLPITCVT